ncbi:MAG: hypothetical protein ACK5P7_06325 [Bdellovibrio sp.]
MSLKVVQATHRFGLKPLLGMSIVLALSGCAFKKDSDKKSEPAPNPTVVLQNAEGDVISETELQVQMIPQEPHQYLARVSWPEGRKATIEVMYYKNPQNIAVNQPPDEDTVDASVINTFDFPCPSRAKINIRLNVRSKGFGPSNTIRKQIVCPIDHTVEHASESTNALPRVFNGRLFFKNGARLQVGLDFLELNLIGIHVEGTATIESKWTADNPSKKPQIKIKAQSASGNLELLLQGHDGRQGESGEEKKFYESFKKLLAQNVMAKGAKGSSGNSAESCRPAPRGEPPICKTVCTRTPGNGGPGTDGVVAGPDGENGGNSSPTPPAHIEIETPLNFKLIALIKHGTPGKGGAKGLGQKGGPGGDPGDLDIDRACPHASAGPAGKNAPDGKDGEDGQTGKCGALILSANLEPLTAVSNIGHQKWRCGVDETFLQLLK